MNRDKPLLTELAVKGKPLAEVGVQPFEQAQMKEIAEALDSLAEDISANVGYAHFQPNDGPEIFQIQMEATKEALFREFGWEIEREKIYDSSEHNGAHPDGYCWKEINKPKHYPKSLVKKIKEMGLIQPGNSDNGLIDDIAYDHSSAGLK